MRPERRPAFRGLDWARLSRADRMVLASAAAFVVWSLIPVWYRFRPGGIVTPGFETGIDAWHGVSVVSGLSAVVAVLWVVIRTADVEVRIPPSPGMVDLALALIGQVFTLIGIAARPAFFSVEWGLFAGIGFGLAWCYAAILRLLQPPATSLRSRETEDQPRRVIARRRPRAPGS